MRIEPVLRLVEAMRAFDIGEVPAGAAENEGGKPFGAEWINQGRPLHRKGTDGRGADVCLEIIDGAFDSQKFERVEIVCLGCSTFCADLGTLIQFLRGNVCTIRPGDCPAV